MLTKLLMSAGMVVVLAVCVAGGSWAAQTGQAIVAAPIPTTLDVQFNGHPSDVPTIQLSPSPTEGKPNAVLKHDATATVFVGCNVNAALTCPATTTLYLDGDITKHHLPEGSAVMTLDSTAPPGMTKIRKQHDRLIWYDATYQGIHTKITVAVVRTGPLADPVGTYSGMITLTLTTR